MKNFILFLLFTLGALQFKAQQNWQDEPHFKLSQNYPNPAKESTSIKLQINVPGPVSLKLYDMLGQPVYTLVDQNLPQGTYFIPVETENMPNGIYFYVIKKDSVSQTMRMIISRQ